ncbi:peptidase domain-containing ABC transporter [Sulfuritalea sp.]|uniref:peptidase domain-containing ABC transporter n=1 Tax=Sulfuritalea sp. TaxID=2480090 RepID=UPI00286E9FF8|nr:peptidase domain-containing ABC transporter [Sulfuritalea sp.]
MTGARLARAEFVRLVAGLCRLQRIPFEAELLLQHFPPDADGHYGLPALFDAADRLGLGVEEVALDRAATATDLPFPLVALPRTDIAVEETAAASPLLLLRAEGDAVRCLCTGAEPPELPHREGLDTLRSRCQPLAWSFSTKAEALRDIDGQTQEEDSRPFGFRWFIPELLRYRKVWRDILAASLALQLVGLVTPLFTQVVIDKIVVHQTQSTLIAVGVGLFLALLFSAAFTWVRQYLVLHTGNRIDAVLGSRVFGHLLRLPLPYFAQRPTGTLVARLHGVETIREFVSGAAVTLLLDLPFMTVLLAVMFWYSWQLSLIVLGLLTLLALLSLAVTPLFRQRLDRQFLLGARNQAFVTEYVAGMETVKSLQLETQLERRYGGFLAAYLAAGFDTKQAANSYNTVANALEQLQSLAVLVVGALLVMQNSGFTIGMLVAFQMFAGRLSQPMLRLVGLYQEFQQADIAVKRLGDLMDAPVEPYALQPSRTRSSDGRIELHGVSFRYSEHHPWLYRHLDLAFRPGRTTLIAGPSGCGKSTLAKLLLGFYRPQDGRIMLDGRDITHFAANELRQTYGVVPQETVLFAGTVIENLQLANPHSGFDEIVAAARMAEIHDSIEALPAGYQTELGEHGVGLSGGQKQRIAIARALLKRPRVLIFDEATANLDHETAEHFARTINQLKGKVTILFIAHQVPRGLQVDEVVTLGMADAVPQGTGEAGDGEDRE